LYNADTKTLQEFPYQVIGQLDPRQILDILVTSVYDLR